MARHWGGPGDHVREQPVLYIDVGDPDVQEYDFGLNETRECDFVGLVEEILEIATPSTRELVSIPLADRTRMSDAG